MSGRHYLRRLDYVLLAAVGGVLVLSYLTISSSARDEFHSDPAFFAGRQLVYVALGLLLGGIVSALDPRRYRPLLWLAYGGLLALLVVVLGISAVKGSSRWIPLPGFQLQPSEVGKLVMIAVVASFVAERGRDRDGSWSVFLRALGLVVPALALVVLEPDLGTAIVYGMVTLVILYVAGARIIQIATVAVVVAAVAFLVLSVLPSAGVRVLQPYQEARLTAFLDPAGHSTAAYQTQEAKTAIGGGGLAGRGVHGALLTNGNFVPEHHTDFIFAVVGEQRGFVGTALLLALFIVIVWRAIRSVTLAASLYESLIAAGIAGMLLTQIFVNVGMTVGIMPTTGIPLPFMTYGGSNTVTNLVAVGLLCAIQIRGSVPEEPALARHASVRGPLTAGLSGPAAPLARRGT